MEKSGDYGGAINLYEQLATFLPDGAIAVSILVHTTNIYANFFLGKVSNFEEEMYSSWIHS